MRNVPQQFNKAVIRRQYLQAAETLMSSLDSWNESLEEIEGLRDLRVELRAKKEVSSRQPEAKDSIHIGTDFYSLYSSRTGQKVRLTVVL